MSNRITFILTTLFTLSHPLLCFVLFIYTETETTIIDHWCFFSLFIYLLFIVTNKRGNISILLRNLVPMSAATLLLLLSVPFCFCLIIFPMCLINLHLLSSIFSLFCPNQTNYLLSFFLSLLYLHSCVYSCDVWTFFTLDVYYTKYLNYNLYLPYFIL